MRSGKPGPPIPSRPSAKAVGWMRGLARSQRREIHAYAAEIVANGGRLSVAE